MNRSILLSALLLAACGSATDQVQEGDLSASNATPRGLIEPAAAVEAPAQVIDDPSSEAALNEATTEGELGTIDPTLPPPPEDVPTIRGLLGARHVADLPAGETLRGYETGEASLQWLANYGDAMATRTRALMLLEHFGTEGTRTFALDYLGQGEPQLQAAAVSALSGQTLDDDQEALDAMSAALRLTDIRVALAAVSTLSEFEAGRAALAEAAADESVVPAIRAAAAQATMLE
jgi:hypothetical protein